MAARDVDHHKDALWAATSPPEPEVECGLSACYQPDDATDKPRDGPGSVMLGDGGLPEVLRRASSRSTAPDESYERPEPRAPPILRTLHSQGDGDGDAGDAFGESDSTDTVECWPSETSFEERDRRGFSEAGRAPTPPPPPTVKDVDLHVSPASSTHDPASPTVEHDVVTIVGRESPVVGCESPVVGRESPVSAEYVRSNSDAGDRPADLPTPAPRRARPPPVETPAAPLEAPAPPVATPAVALETGVEEAKESATPRVFAWSRSLARVVSFGARRRGPDARLLAEFFDAPSAEDARTLALLREGIAVMLHARLPGTARRVSLVHRVLLLLEGDDGGRLCLCVREGQALVDADHNGFRCGDVDAVGLGPCTAQLHLSLARQHGDLRCADAADHGKRVFSIFGEGRSVDLEIALRGSARRAQVVTAQEAAVAVARAVHKRCAPRGLAAAVYRRLLASDVETLAEDHEGAFLHLHYAPG